MFNRRYLLNTALGLSSTSALLGLSGCAAPSVEDYAMEVPKLNLKNYFNGVIDAWGIFTDRSGKVIKRFTVVMNCSWAGETAEAGVAGTVADAAGGVPVYAGAGDFVGGPGDAGFADAGPGGGDGVC